MMCASYLFAKPHRKSDETMRKEYDFLKGKRRAVLPTKGKTRITIFLDDAILTRFKALSERTGKGDQTLINDALNAHVGVAEPPITREVVRRIVREELQVSDLKANYRLERR